MSSGTESKGVEEDTQQRPSHDGLDSSDDEDDHKLPSKTSDHHFNFYDHLHFNFAPFHDILSSINTLRAAYKQHKDDLAASDEKMHSSSLKKKSQVKLFDIREYQKTMHDTSNPKKLNHTISKFRLDEPRWDGTAVPSPELEKELYRTPVADSSGTVIKSLGRDLAKGKKWAPPEYDRDLPEPTFANCSDSRKRIVLQHMDEVIAKVEVEYKKMKADTQDKSSIKARIGADLNELKRKRERLLREIAEKEAVMQAKAESKRNKSPKRSKKDNKEQDEMGLQDTQEANQSTQNQVATEVVDGNPVLEEIPSVDSSAIANS